MTTAGKVAAAVVVLALLIPLSGVILVGVPYAYSAAKDFVGFCPSEGRYLTDQGLTDQDKIRRVVEHINGKLGVQFVPIDNNPQGDGQRIKYPSVDAFLSANPNCCFVKNNVVHVTYIARYIDDSGKEYATKLDEAVPINACGKPLAESYR